MDESSRRTLAEAAGLKVRGNLYIIIEALKKELLDEKQCERNCFNTGE